MKQGQRGFTLVELMVVVTVVAILAAIAVPVYQSYTIRAKISEALAAAGACKTSVSDYMSTNASPPHDLAASGCANDATQWVGGIDVLDGVITVTLASTPSLGDASGTAITLTPTVAAGNFVTAWTCANGSPAVPAKYLPGPCRGG